MKKMRKLVPAFAMLMVAAIMMSTASFAWFSMSDLATATGMQVQAKADAGILISNGNGTWASSAATDQTTTPVKLMPVSTIDGSTWNHTTSDNAESANAHSETADYVSFAKTQATGDYYLYNSFYIKSSSNEALARDIEISNVTITETQDLALNESMRVLVICDGTHYIYSLSGGKIEVLETPKATAASGKNEFKEITVLAHGSLKTDSLGVTSIPNVNVEAEAGAILVEVYIYFEGEDARCISNNLKAAVDTLQVDITFSLGADTTP